MCMYYRTQFGVPTLWPTALQAYNKNYYHLKAFIYLASMLNACIERLLGAEGIPIRVL